MPIIQLIVILIVIGVLLWLANTYLPMDPKIKNIMNIVVVIAVVLWLISIFVPGIWHAGPRVGGGTLPCSIVLSS